MLGCPGWEKIAVIGWRVEWLAGARKVRRVVLAAKVQVACGQGQSARSHACHVNRVHERTMTACVDHRSAEGESKGTWAEEGGDAHRHRTSTAPCEVFRAEKDPSRRRQVLVARLAGRF